MVNVHCNIQGNKTRFAKDIAKRLHGKIEAEEKEHLQISFDSSSEAHKFNRFMIVIKQSFA